jgi:hypothetical protein
MMVETTQVPETLVLSPIMTWLILQKDLMHFIEWYRLLSLPNFKDISIHMLVILLGVIFKILF